MPVVYDAGVRGASAKATATSAVAVPAPKKAHHRPTRSAIHPPATHPTALTTPLNTPVTRATRSALARQSGAIADHRLLAAQAPIGDTTSAIVSSGTGDRTIDSRSWPTLRSWA